MHRVRVVLSLVIVSLALAACEKGQPTAPKPKTPPPASVVR